MRSCTFLWLLVFAYSAFSMDGDIEKGNPSHLVEMTSSNNGQQSLVSDLAEQKFQVPALTNPYPPMRRILRLNEEDLDEGKSDLATTHSLRSDFVATHALHTDSIDSMLLGNQGSNYSNLVLEHYTKKSSTFWNFIHSILGDLDGISHAGETALTVCTQFLPSGHISIYVIEMTMIADALHKLYSLSQRIAPIREKQARWYESQNIKNNLIKQNPNRQLLIGGKDASENTDFYASKNVACWYNFCATYRNITWDQVGVIAILCRVFANSIITFSLASNPHKCKTLLFGATLLRIAGTFCHLYAKSLSKNTKEMEQKAIDSSNFIEYQERIKKNSVVPAESIHDDHVAEAV